MDRSLFIWMSEYERTILILTRLSGDHRIDSHERLTARIAEDVRDHVSGQDGARFGGNLHDVVVLISTVTRRVGSRQSIIIDVRWNGICTLQHTIIFPPW